MERRTLFSLAAAAVLNPREIGRVGNIFIQHLEQEEQKRNFKLIKWGQLTPYGKDDTLAILQILYRTGFNTQIMYDNKLRKQFLALRDTSLEGSPLVLDNDLIKTILPRFPGGLQFVQDLFNDQVEMPLCVAPDALDFNIALGQKRSPWDYIGKTVSLEPVESGGKGKPLQGKNAYIVDFLNEKHRGLNPFFFTDATPRTYKEVCGLTYDPKGPTYFRDNNNNPVNTLPFIEMYFDSSQLD